MSDNSAPSDWPSMIEDCQKHEGKLSDWERGFIDSIERQLSQPGRTLSEKQRETLDRIWDRIT
jgi:hypothetical protein